MSAAAALASRQLSAELLCTAVLTLFLLSSGVTSQRQPQNITIDAIVPAAYETRGTDQYVCFRVDLPPRGLKITGVHPLSTQDVVHHMLLFGCGSTGAPNEPYSCHMSSPCNGGFERVLYGWGKNAPPMTLPDGVGYSVGPGSAIQGLVLQVHYLQERPIGDTSGVRLHMGSKPTPFAAGMINYASYFTIPPGKPKHPIENECCYSGFEILKGFAFRVHTHALGRSVNLERTLPGTGTQASEELCEKDPQLPQGFTPLKTDIVIKPGDTLKATCMFDSTSVKQAVNAGATHNDEMCNLYLMLYSQLPYFMACYGSPQVEKHGMGGIPLEGRVEPDIHTTWDPPPGLGATSPPIAKKATGGIGQVSAVAKGHHDDIWIFHRGTKVWDAQTFQPGNSSNTVTDPKAFIAAETVMQLHQDTGKVLTEWGSKKFLMPHGLTVDMDGNIWVTDVGLHQALKFSPQGKQLLALGTALEPGDDNDHFCKPTHVVVGNDGSVFVADGYCNSRVVRFSRTGKFEAEYKLPRGSMDVPHSLVLDECLDGLYVADREHSQVHKFSIAKTTLQGTWELKKHGHVYSITAGPYGTVLALCWLDRHDPRTEVTHIVLLSSDHTGGGAESVWRVEGGVGAPHDFALAAAPMPAHGTGDRALAVFIAETKAFGSQLRKYIFLPEGVSMEDVIEGGVEEEVILPDTIPQGHGVEAALAADHEKELGGVEAVLAAEHVKEIGGVGNAVSLHVIPGEDSGIPEEHALVTTKLNADVPRSEDGLANSRQTHGSSSKLSDLLLGLKGRSKSKIPDVAKADAAVQDMERDPLLPAADAGSATELAAGLPSAADESSTESTAQTQLFSGHGSSSGVDNQTGVFSGTLARLFAFGMPFVVICAGAAVVYQRRSRGSHGHHHHTPKV